jgi:hypothetical protein
MEDRVLFLQKKLNSAVEFSNFSMVKKINVLLLNSLCGRLKVSKEILSTSFLPFSYNSFSITNADFIDIIFALNFKLNLPSKFSFYLTKITNQSFYFEFINVYDKTIQSIWNLTLSPILEVVSGKSWLGFRPFRQVEYSVLSVRNILYKLKSNSWVLKLDLDLSVNFFDSCLFLKRFFLGVLCGKRSLNYFYVSGNSLFWSVFSSVLLNGFL